jgi:hypothetical protein
VKPKDLLLLYASEYKQRFGRQYPIVWGKDSKQAKRLLDLYSAEDLRRMIPLYVHSFQDAWHVRAGKSFGTFVLALPALVALLASEEQSKPVASSDAEKLKKAREDYETALRNNSG